MTALREADVLASLFPYPRLMLERGEGVSVWDSDGKRYLDFTSGLGVLALGHGRQDMAEIVKEQYLRLGHCSNLFGHAPQLELAARLTRLSFASRVFFANSGTEVNEAALKFARLCGRAKGGPRKHVLVAFEQGFHGRTMGSLSVTHEPTYREPFAPLIEGVRFAPFNDVETARAAIDADVCGVIVEPVQGEGGVIPATSEFLRALRERCDAHGAQLIFDEVQCGVGRVGKLFAYQHYGVTPDIMTLAKPLAAGLPLGACLVGDHVAKLLEPGQHGTTFGGGPVTCKLACAVLDIIAQESFLQAVEQRAARLRGGLDKIATDSAIFSGARGLGLMQALVVRDVARHKPADILAAARARGLLITRAGSDAIRFLPPLTCSDADIDEALHTFAAATQDLA